MSPRGAMVLARWCEAWRTNALPAAVRQQWLFSHVVALDKGGGKARPILLQEALLKLATGTIVQMHQSRIQRAVGTSQHGLGGSVGAPQVIWQIRAAMASAPYATFLGIDCRNAFGTITRPAVIAEADMHVPQISTMLRAIWQDVTPRMLIKERDGSLLDHPVVDGLAQGGCDSQPAFCLGIARALRTFREQCAERNISVRIWAYVDDVVLQLPAERTQEAVQILDDALRDIGLERRPDKCRWHVPGPNSTASYPAEVGAPAAGGLPVLGSAADGAFSTVIGPCDDCSDATTQPARDRVAQATQLAGRIADLMHADIAVPVLHAAFKLTTGVVNHALSYDICVLPSATVGALADQLDEIVLKLIHDIVGTGWMAHTEELLRLPRAAGGCGVLSTADRAHTAFLSTVLRCPPAATDAPQAWQDAGVLAACDHSISWLQQRGVWLDSWAMPQAQQPPEGNLLSAQKLPCIPLPGRQSCWRARMAEVQAQTIQDAVPYFDSRAGEEGGALLGANGGDMQVDLTDTEFRNYLRMRLGLQVCTHQKCQHRAMSDQGKTCPQISDPMGYHALLCKLGGGLTSTHNAVCVILLRAARSAGFTALKEQVIAELATAQRKEPRVDVDAWGLVAEPRVLLDVTVTCPFAQRYEDKRAVECGERRKDKEYPSKAGLAVTGVAVDVFGKHGPALQDLLMRFADLARQHEVDQGVQPRRWLHRWRVRISTEIARGCSRQICTANSAAAPVRQAQPAFGATPAAHPTTTAVPGAPPTGCVTIEHGAPAAPSLSSGRCSVYSVCSQHQQVPAAIHVQRMGPPACSAAADVQTAARHTTPTTATSLAEQTA